MGEINCYRCCFFEQGGKPKYVHDGDDPRAIHGECYLNPQHVNVTAAHYCSRYFPSYMNTMSVVREYEEVLERKSGADQRSRRIDAEKKLKAARAEIRRLRAQKNEEKRDG